MRLRFCGSTARTTCKRARGATCRQARMSPRAPGQTAITCKGDTMSRRDWIEISTSLLGGAGIGAALMYLFDPDQGSARRAQAREAAGDALSTTGETLGSAWQTIAEKARDAGVSVAEYTERLAHRASSTASDYADDA